MRKRFFPVILAKTGRLKISNSTTVNDVLQFSLESHTSRDGTLFPIDFSKILAHDVKRLFYVCNVESREKRGNHAHHTTRQTLICINGEVKVTCSDGSNSRSFVLNSPGKALYIPEMIWDTCEYNSTDSILLALSNTEYDREDYIEDYNEFLELKRV